jgi:16S rRNA (cytosine967-C5)-methyltransferase
MDVRATSAQVLERVLRHGQSLNEALPAELTRLDPGPDRALAQALVYGVLRGYSRYEAIAARLLQHPLRAKDADVHLLLLGGLFELQELRTPDHAAVSATAGAARELRKAWAVKLLNAVLRRFVRERDALLASLADDPVARCAHPEWILRRLQQAWPEHWEAIVAANNAQAPMTLRVNRRRSTRQTYLERLADAGIEARAHPLAPDALVLAKPVPVERLPGFAEGAASVQDAAAQLAAELLDTPPGARVLDACAAPGGKACHILERQPELAQLVAVDVDARRTERVQENLARLQLTAEVRVADVADTAAWWDGRPFERILLDAPCSGSGVIRRHPDIKWLRRDSDIAVLAQGQHRVLRALWPLLAPGGKLLYVTCSVFPDENEALVHDFLTDEPSACAEAATPAELGIPLAHGLQLLPGANDMDGFYYACLSKP